LPLIFHAAASGCLDRPEEAKPVVQRLLELQPGLTIGIAILSVPQYVNPENIAALESGLRPRRVAGTINPTSGCTTRSRSS
jgi:hypothetical protein